MNLTIAQKNRLEIARKQIEDTINDAIFGNDYIREIAHDITPLEFDETGDMITDACVNAVSDTMSRLGNAILAGYLAKSIMLD